VALGGPEQEGPAQPLLYPLAAGVPMTLAISRCASAFVLALGLTSAAWGQTLTLGTSTEFSSADPHYHNLSPNNGIARHIFDALILSDEHQAMIPGLATSWRPLNETTWEVNLRRGVKFHDGSDFTAADVVYSLQRVPNVPNSPGPFTVYTKFIKSAETPDPFTVVFHTAAPYPLLPSDLSNIYIVSRKTEGRTTEDFNAGRAAIGTGPYRFVEWVRGDRLVLQRNPSYWGGVEPWEKVVFKPLTNDAARVAALLAGDVDLIDVVPSADLERVKRTASLSLFQVVSNRVIYLHMDSDREHSPFITGAAGKNPLKDVRVRHALSLAINRPAIADRVMEGLSLPANQLLPEGFFGSDPALPAAQYDPEGAKKLLAEAGYANGFGVTLHSPNNRYPNDEKIAQAVAQMLSRVDIATKVEAMPSNIFFSRGTKLEFSLLLSGWGSGTGEVSSPLRALLATYNKDTGMGSANRGRYSNPRMDAVLQQALETVDDAKREKLLREAVRLAMEDYGIIPIHYNINTWASKKELIYVPRTDEFTLAMSTRRR
jgi:peptide/nickel transport system substrate-binding protein